MIKIDRYTKFLLTIIAACLIWISIQLTITPAQAGKDIIDVNIEKIDGFSFGRNLPVEIKGG